MSLDEHGGKKRNAPHLTISVRPRPRSLPQSLIDARMPNAEVLRKDQLEIRYNPLSSLQSIPLLTTRSLREEKRLIENGILKEDNPLDNSENFRRLCEACRRGDLKICQEMINEGVNINAKDLFDYTPLILVS
jgi:ankyrin repeat/BTB/POZ domain-containing protein 1